MIIGVDIDNVVADTEKELRRVLRKRWGIGLEREDITDYALKNLPGIDGETYAELVELFREGGIFLDLDVFDGAKETLERLVSKYEVHLVTSRPERVRDKTLEWLKMHEIPYNKLIFSEHTKLNGVQYELFIEDQENFAVELAESGAFVLLFDAPWNRHVEHVNIDRVYGWDDIQRFCFPPCALGH
jgi:uncharacterized protein